MEKDINAIDMVRQMVADGQVSQEVEKLKSNLLYGACSSQIAMETRCKEEAYNEVLAILDTMQEQHVKESEEIQHEDKSCEDNGNSLTKEPTSWLDEFRAKLDSLSKEEFEQLWGKYGAEEKEELVSSIWHDASEKSNEPEDVVIIDPSDNTGEVLTNCTDVYSGRIWSYTSDLLNLDNPCKIGKNLQEEPVSEDSEETSGLNMQRAQDFIEGYHQAEKDLTDKAKTSSGWDGFYYGQGYKQAEKDLELTYDDICEIMEIREDVLEMDSYENLYEEILKRFKDLKKGKRNDTTSK